MYLLHHMHDSAPLSLIYMKIIITVSTQARYVSEGDSTSRYLTRVSIRVFNVLWFMVGRSMDTGLTNCNVLAQTSNLKKLTG